MVRKLVVLVLLLASCCLGIAACSGKKPSASAAGIAEKGKEFVSLLAEGKFEEAATWLDPTLTAVMPPAKLQEAWNTLAPRGAYMSETGARSAQEQGYDVAYVTCAFEKGNVTAKVVFDRSGKVSGLWFV